jgi:hypothetical protein
LTRAKKSLKEEVKIFILTKLLINGSAMSFYLQNKQTRLEFNLQTGNSISFRNHRNNPALWADSVSQIGNPIYH